MLTGSMRKTVCVFRKKAREFDIHIDLTGRHYYRHFYDFVFSAVNKEILSTVCEFKCAHD